MLTLALCNFVGLSFPGVIILGEVPQTPGVVIFWQLHLHISYLGGRFGNFLLKNNNFWRFRGRGTEEVSEQVAGGGVGFSLLGGRGYKRHKDVCRREAEGGAKYVLWGPKLQPSFVRNSRHNNSHVRARVSFCAAQSCGKLAQLQTQKEKIINLTHKRQKKTFSPFCKLKSDQKVTKSDILTPKVTQK